MNETRRTNWWKEIKRKQERKARIIFIFVFTSEIALAFFFGIISSLSQDFGAKLYWRNISLITLIITMLSSLPILRYLMRKF